MKTLGYLACSSELQLIQEYEKDSDSQLGLLYYDRIDQDRKLKEQSEGCLDI
jgi:hypothetical protein